VADPGNSSDMLLAGIQTMIAEDESEKISQRVADGKQSAALRGRRSGRVPYGYRQTFDPRTGEPGPDEPDPGSGHGPGPVRCRR